MTQKTEQETTEDCALRSSNNNTKQVPAHLITARKRRERETRLTM